MDAASIGTVFWAPCTFLRGERTPTDGPEGAPLESRGPNRSPNSRWQRAHLLAHPGPSPPLTGPLPPPQVATKVFEWEYDSKELKEAELRGLLWEEILKFHPTEDSCPRGGRGHRTAIQFNTR